MSRSVRIVAPGLVALACVAVPDARAGSSQEPSAGQETERRGLVRNDPGAEQGYTLFCSFGSSVVYLIDMEGQVVHRWEHEGGAGNPYLLDGGDIVFCTDASDEPHKVFTAPGGAGRVVRLDWHGEQVWELTYSSEDYLQHHDIAVTPYGTVLLIAWEKKESWEAIESGRDPALLGRKALWPDHVVELEPVPPDGAELIWEWHAWDHLIQDFDPDRKNYGVVSEHPELIDINGDDPREEISDEELEQLEALGYLADAAGASRERGSDWLHSNAIDYHPDLDQIVLSVPRFCELWVLDHSTSFDEAAGHEGGRSGKGGDLLYRWGNPICYRMGSPADRVLDFQHDTRWVPAGYPGSGRLTVFNNGRSNGYSSILEIEAIPDEQGLYPREDGMPFGPAEPVWDFRADGFYSDFVSGAHRLPNGNTFLCEGATGRLLEVTREGKVVWEYLNPYRDTSEDGARTPFGLFRATRIHAGHPALKDRILAPIEPAPAGGDPERR